MTRAEIINQLRTSLHEMFDIAPQQITEQARLREDLDLDSIDAIDLAVRLKTLIGRRIELSKLRELRTVGDVVDLIFAEVENGSLPQKLQADSPSEDG